MADDFVNIEVNGVAVKARKGEMIIRVTDAHHAYVPRFCYHDKLSIAANCRMCLVEVEKAPKPLPACATPVAEGMKIFTNSPRAIGAQRATMEFLLINHPLDCPICDQGGECELQDLAVGFGRDASRFHEKKRVVPDENLGPLIATDMTRCIQCTRCVRFTEEIAGMQELGMIGRGEGMKVRVAIDQTVHHELSGNIIDLCPVGALVSKPYRFTARAWEMGSRPLVSPHDGFGTNLFGHVLRGKLMRVVPRENEEINETWIPDRDRFSYEGVYSADRLMTPMIRTGGDWSATDWETALAQVAIDVATHARSIGALASPSSTLEELYLLNRLMRAVGSDNIDHRLRQHVNRDQDADPAYPSLGMPIAAVERLDALLVVGCNLRAEVPMLAHRVRKAALRGAKVAFVNPARFEYRFSVAAYHETSPAALVGELAAILTACLTDGQAPPAQMSGLVRAAQVDERHRAVAAALKSGERRAIWLGALSLRHPAYADLRALAVALGEITGATFGVLAEGANAAGAYLAGAVPHRTVGGHATAAAGLSAWQMLRESLSAYLLLGVEPWDDTLDRECVRTLAGAHRVIAITPFTSATLREVAHVLLPIGTFAETYGTFVNFEGRWQSFAGAATPVGEARPGWKVLRVLGNALGFQGFEYQSAEEVRDEVRRACVEPLQTAYTGRLEPRATHEPATLVDVPMYYVDGLVRRAPSLQRTRRGEALPALYE
ncbi:MAG TPA: NADH-quinone oxidoreductase subunit NuoG [Steroidobacteraceae bacterium]|jgi:NADH-quinone oxidoreductase subunit G